LIVATNQEIPSEGFIPKGVDADVAEEVGQSDHALDQESFEFISEELREVLEGQHHLYALPAFLPADGESQGFNTQLESVGRDEPEVTEGGPPLLVGLPQRLVVEFSLEMEDVGQAEEEEEAQIQTG
jgi:hypothetical protein